MSQNVPMAMTAAWDLQVFLEYGQFYLEPARAEDDPYWDPEASTEANLLPDMDAGDSMDDTEDILLRALGWDGSEYAAPDVAPGIAQGRYTTIVVTPHRDNNDMDLRVELHDGPPPDDLADWQEVFEAAGVAAGPGGMWYHTPTMDSTPLPIPAGTYKIRISGRDFFRPEWSEENDTLHYDDKYRFQLWPDAASSEPVRLKRWDHPESCGHV